MELKRYVMVSSGGIVDTEKLNKYNPLCLTTREGYLVYTGPSRINKYYGKIIETSNNVYDLIKEEDYVMVDDELFRVYYDYHEISGKGIRKLTIIDKYSPYGRALDDEFVDITAIYKFNGDNLICVWKRGVKE